MTEKQLANLAPTLDKLPKERRREIQRMGAEASNRVQREKREKRKWADILMNRPLEDDKKNDFIKKLEEEYGQEATTALVMANKFVQKALSGHLPSYQYLNHLIAEDPLIESRIRELDIRQQEVDIKAREVDSKIGAEAAMSDIMAQMKEYLSTEEEITDYAGLGDDQYDTPEEKEES